MTVHKLVSMATAVKINIGLLKEALAKQGVVLDPATQLVADNLTVEAQTLYDGLNAFSLDVGAGIYPNTFQTTTLPYTYRIVNDETEEDAAEEAGMVVAFFPQTMTKAGQPDLVVHNQDQKETAVRNGYTLPGL
jgi:hypothetical protein